MRKLLLILLAVISLQVNAQDLKKIFKFGTVYGAVNGGTSLSDQDVYSVTNGLQTDIIETPYDYSIILGIRKQKRFGYKRKTASKMVQKIHLQMVQHLVDGIIKLNFYLKVNIKDKKVKFI